MKSIIALVLILSSVQVAHAEVLEPTFESIDRLIIQNTCTDCHNPGGEGKRVPLDKKSLLDSPLDLVLPGNPSESGLVLSLERTDDKRMPPAADGYDGLTAEEIAIIKTWIANGAN